MKRQFETFIALCLLTGSAAALPATAGEADTLRVTVPFAFTAGTATLPAGDYVISQQADSHFLTIGGKGGGAILAAVSQNPPGELRTSNLTFERSGKGNTLTEIQMLGRQSIILNHLK
jgi:hypothetical protein